ncbi:unnamed protein product [Amoebophrya sp. A120]|nr:unnamed protein product [Amoebophrya sp. A120]|eukprot:GSA120T00002417001.1
MATTISESPSRREESKRLPQLLRDGSLADCVTAGNAVSGICAILGCMYASKEHLRDVLTRKNDSVFYTVPERDLDPAWALRVAFWFLPLGLVCDIMDGFVARLRKASSPFGADLDSLADLVTFGVAPSVFGFVLGLDGGWDACCLLFFLLCGVARLARYNVTASLLSDTKTGQVSFFQGLPIPASLWLCLFLYIDFELSQKDTSTNLASSAAAGQAEERISFFGGAVQYYSEGAARSAEHFGLRLLRPVVRVFGSRLHLFSLCYLATGSALISTFPVPKPDLNCQRRKDTLPQRSKSAQKRLEKHIGKL